MGNFLDMRSRILDELVNESITDNQVQNAVWDAIKEREKKFYWFTQQTAALVTVPGQEYYTDTDLDGISRIRKITSAYIGTYPLKERFSSNVDDYRNISGRPIFFSRVNTKIRLSPVPDAVYSIDLTWWGRLAPLVDDTDTNAWLDDGEELIRQTAKFKLALDILHSDEDAARFSSLAERALRALRDENRKIMPEAELRNPEIARSFGFNINTGL